MKKKYKKRSKRFEYKKQNKNKKINYEEINLLNESINDNDEIFFSFPKFSIFKCIYNIVLLCLALLLLIFLHNYLKKSKIINHDKRNKNKYINDLNNKTIKL